MISCIRADSQIDIDSKYQVVVVQPTPAAPVLCEVSFRLARAVCCVHGRVCAPCALGEYRKCKQYNAGSLDDLYQQDQKQLDHVRRARVAVLMYRLSTIREVVLSGFQLSLYTNEERVFAYWYVSQVLEMHLSCIDQLMPGMSSGTWFHVYDDYIELIFSIQTHTPTSSCRISCDSSRHCSPSQ